MRVALRRRRTAQISRRLDERVDAERLDLDTVRRLRNIRCGDRVPTACTSVSSNET